MTGEESDGGRGAGQGGGVSHTCFPDKHLLRRAAGTLAHRVVDAHADLVALVFAEL